MQSEIQPEVPGVDAARLQRAFGILQQWLDDGVVTAIASLVLRHGQLAGAFYGGRVDPAPDSRAVEASSLFHLASIGKPITGLAVMTLVEQGRLALDDQVSDLLPGFTGGGRESITVRQLLCHTSGLPQDPNMAGVPDGADTATELRSYLNSELAVPVGSKVEYSNVGYGMLGLLIEAVSALPFATYMRQAVFGPLGMANSYLAPDPALYPRIVNVGGTADPGSASERFNSAYHRQRTHPAGSVIATAEDVARFFQLFLNDGRVGGQQVIAPATARLMRTNQTAGLRGGIEGFMTWEECSWGLGFELRGTKQPHYSGEYASAATFGHTGVAGTFAWADPASDLICIMLANRQLHNFWNRSRWSRYSTAVAAAVYE